MNQTRSRVTTLACTLFLLVLTVLAVANVLPPSPQDDDAPAGEFSAGRAFADVEVVGAEIHPTGTSAAHDVRDYLVERLDELGLEAEVTDGVGMSGRLGGQSRVADVQNVVATIPGTDATKPLFLMAHYDSAEVSHGGNDDGAGLATILETVRALATGPALRNDVVLVLTDAEESCLCGAEAFVDADPRGADGGVVLNFEARGSAGPAVMFETSSGNADLVDAYASVPYPVGSSLAVEVYRILPNDTDFSPFLDDPAARFTGLNTAYIDGSATYHSPQDTPERMSLASLQHHGSNALALTRTLGDADLATLATPSDDDATYFPLPGRLVAAYPGWLVWPLALLALGAVAALAVVVARRRGGDLGGGDSDDERGGGGGGGSVDLGDGGARLSGPGRLALGFVSGLLPLAGAVLGAMGLWWFMVALRPGYGEMLDPWQPWGFRVALLGIVALVTTGWFVGLRRRLGGVALGVGALGWLAVLGAVLAAFAPGGSYLAALPALAGAVAGLVAVFAQSETVRTVVVTVGAAVGVLVLAPVVLLFVPALGLATGAAPAVVAALLGLALVPFLVVALPTSRRAGAWLVGACGVLAVGAFGVGLAVDSFDAEHPEPTVLGYALDADTGDAWWLSDEGEPSDWTAQYVDGQETLEDPFPMVHGEVWTGPAEAAELPSPAVEVISDATSGDERVLTLQVRPGEGPQIGALDALRYIAVDGGIPGNADGHGGAEVLAIELAGREVPVADDGGIDTRFVAPESDGFRLTVTVPAGAELDLRVVSAGGGLEGLPGFVERPAGVGVAGSHTAELVLVGTTVVL